MTFSESKEQFINFCSRHRLWGCWTRLGAEDETSHTIYIRCMFFKAKFQDYSGRLLKPNPN